MFASETLKHESNNVWNMYTSLSNISFKLESAISLFSRGIKGCMLELGGFGQNHFIQ